MEWNNGKERAKFEREQARLRKEYLAAGMTEEQIQAMYEFDRAYLNLQQREARHTQRLNITAFDEDESDESQNPLLKKFLHNFSVEDKHWEDDRFGWIEEIEDEKLYLAVNSLSDTDKELLTKYIFDGLTQMEIAEQLGVSQQSISKKIKKFQTFFRKWL